jgi:hypothetical protein
MPNAWKPIHVRRAQDGSVFVRSTSGSGSLSFMSECGFLVNILEAARLRFVNAKSFEFFSFDHIGAMLRKTQSCVPFWTERVDCARAAQQTSDLRSALPAK